jgi:hypothetical protein
MSNEQARAELWVKRWFCQNNEILWDRGGHYEEEVEAFIAALCEAEARGLEAAVTRIQEAREDGESDLRSLIHWCRSQATARRAGKGA